MHLSALALCLACLINYCPSQHGTTDSIRQHWDDFYWSFCCFLLSWFRVIKQLVSGVITTVDGMKSIIHQLYAFPQRRNISAKQWNRSKIKLLLILLRTLWNPFKGPRWSPVCTFWTVNIDVQKYNPLYGLLYMLVVSHSWNRLASADTFHS